MNRSKTVLISICLAFIVVLSKFFYWQIIQGPVLYLRAISQTLKPEKILPKRGTIYDRNNNPLAFSSHGYKLSVYKPNIKQPLSQLIDIIESSGVVLSPADKKSLEKFTNTENLKWITLDHLFTYPETQKLVMSGLTFSPTDKRIYPENKIARNVIGYISSGQDKAKGISGLENYYQKQLQGKTGYLWSTKDATGNIVISKRNWIDQVKNGLDIHTSLDRTIQFWVESKLNEGVEKYQADSGSVAIIEPDTGKIIALASIEKTATSSATKITPIADLFEPGSIFKPLVVAMALDTNSIDENYQCPKCNQPRIFGQYTIGNWDNEFHPNSSLADIIKNSDNIGMSFIVEKLGLKKFRQYFSQLNLDSTSNIDLPGEARPINKNYWSDLDLATASFGQGFALNQIQMISAFNTIANNGLYIEPSIARTSPPISHQVFKVDTTTKLKKILQYSVENGVVSKLRPKNLNVCAKSGTAQVASNGEYVDANTIASYIGFSPCDKPKFTMIVTINNPKTSPWGSSTAAPIWYDLAEKISILL